MASPMILMGDEWLRTQGGNNNAYCQDNELNWLDWENGDSAFFEFVAGLIALRRTRPLLRVQKFRHGRPIGEARIPDVAWLRADGEPMESEDWHGTGGRVALMLSGIGQRSLALLFNPLPDDVEFMMPAHAEGTKLAGAGRDRHGLRSSPSWTHLDPGAPMTLGGRAVCLLETLEPLK